MSQNPRLVAYQTLMETGEGRIPEEILNEAGLLLAPRDMALATALVYEVLRHRAYLTWLVQSRLTGGRAVPEVLQVLRLGLAQLLYFDRLGDHAIVSETVTLAKIVVPGRHGLVNAVLRSLLRDREAGAETGAVWPPLPAPTSDKTQDLARQYSYQPWMVKKLMARYGAKGAESILVASNQAIPPTLRSNPKWGERDKVAAQLGFATLPTQLSPWGLSAQDFNKRPENWPGYQEGAFAVQDEASQLVGLLAGELPLNSKVLDACAGLGGKALNLACLHPQVQITALDKDPAKLELLERETKRLGCSNIQTQVGNLLTLGLGEGATENYNLVLVDAPCTGLGVIRRRPDLKWNKTADDLHRLAKVQLALLIAGAALVAPGGRLLYGVCSFSLEEGPEVVQKFLAERPDFKALEPEAWPEVLQPNLEKWGLTLRPDLQGTDGFFWACFVLNPT